MTTVEADLVAVFGDFEQVVAILGAEPGDAEVVDDENLGPPFKPGACLAREASSLG